MKRRRVSRAMPDTARLFQEPPHGRRWRLRVALWLVAGPPVLFVLLSPLLALLGYLTGLFPPRWIGDAVVLILLGIAVIVALAGAVLAVVAAALAGIGAVGATVVSVLSHVFSRLER